MKRFFALIFLSIAISAVAQYAPASSAWQGKKVAILGDSMSDPNLAPDTKRFYGYLADSIGIVPFPYAVSGYQWKDLYGKAVQMREERGNSLDAIFIWAGTNDYNASMPIGSFFTEGTAVVNVNGNEVERKHRVMSDDKSTFCGNINNLLGYLKTEYPDKEIYILTPIHRGYARFSDRNVQPSEEYANGHGLYIDDYVEVLRQAGRIWSVPVIDLFAECGLLPALPSNTMYISNEATDRLHPNALGHQRIACTVSRKLH